MRYKKNFLVFMFLITGCVSTDVQKYFKNGDPENLIRIQNGALSHFPRKFESTRYKTYQVLIKEDNRIAVFLQENIQSPDFFEQKTEQLEKLGFLVLNPVDSNCVMLSYDEALGNYLEGYITADSSGPIKVLPDFEKALDDKSLRNYLQDANTKIYIIDSNFGDIYHLGLSENKNLPQVISNGSTKGITINEARGIIIYWLLIW